MKKFLGILFFYILLVVLLLPFVVTFFLGGFGRAVSYAAFGF